MASEAVRLRFLAMERSLRAVGCDLPLWVIPYDETRFDLPPNAMWWELPAVCGWLRQQRAHPVMRKYQCLLEANYQFVDSDVIFLRNPADVLRPHSGFVTSCGHWHNPGETLTPESRRILHDRTTIWPSRVFNTGQFACDAALYDFEGLKATALRPDFAGTCVRWRFNEQPGLNLLVFHSGVPVTNLTLPPVSMESTWAGDYPGDFEKYWTAPERKPYLIHWAGMMLDRPLPIHELFYAHLTRAERAQWDEQTEARRRWQQARERSLRNMARRIRRALTSLITA